ncbi:hypothetical protein MBM_03109 [Drepanopeziza brunnea f. sp. 'multigermtubi' MB_m1]|uniref:Uncharacterized protein n=1 Tax=Marssonina brunnea f. sp. multigermtubi (strain MB_m1) TaxID=1072389 RepID=K1X1H0_MARBU|nr:uncharacterized protein MBM_03109 [Drepanopeziza brunnea f. sp. 'multigermtubi' MB_m1]EKD18867.1 hypothetical protein MBM_03109 [Drepanopeziza brunnea f. sp. 'multigermtubi' MB_m1]
MSSYEDDGPSPLTRIAQLESLVKQLRMALSPAQCVLFSDPDNTRTSFSNLNAFLFGFSAFRLFGSSGPFGFSLGPFYGFSSSLGPFRSLKTAFARPRAPLSFGDLTDLPVLKYLQHVICSSSTCNTLSALSTIKQRLSFLEDRNPTLQHAPHSSLDQQAYQSTRCGAINLDCWGLRGFDSDEKEEILAEWNASGGYDADPDDYRDL